MPATRMKTNGVANARTWGRGRRHVLIGLGFAVCLLMINGIVGDNGAFALMRARAQYADMANAVATKKAENARMREQWRRLETDPSAIEDIARRELDLIKPGEMLFIVRDAPGARKKEER